MIRIRSQAAWVLAAWLPVAITGAGPFVQAEDAPRPAAPGSVPLPASVPADERHVAPAPLPVKIPAVAPAEAAAAPVKVPAAAEAVQIRAALPAGIVIGNAAFVPRRVIVDANGVQRVVPAAFDTWAFGTSGARLDGAEMRRRNLATLLQRRLETIDAVCNLTPQQREQLEFLGRGDIARLFAALAQVKEEVEAAKDDFERIEEIYRANATLRRSAISGPFGEDSLLFKSIDPLLDPDQVARFDCLRELLRYPEQFVREENGLLNLQIMGIPFDDRGLAALARLGSGKDGRALRIRQLYLNGTKVTDAGLARLPGSATLESLSLSGNAIGDAGLVDLGRFPNLKQLNLAGLAITDQTLEEIGELKHLTSLSLSSAQVSNEGVECLRDLRELTSLTLQGVRISDEAMAHLEKLTSLQVLMISQTNVTDAGIARLKGLTRLRVLYVRGSKVTSEGISELKKSLPNLRSDSDVIVRGI